MSTLSADSRLRNKVGAVDGTVILVGAGHVDRVIRFTRLPNVLSPFKTKVDGVPSVFPVVLNLDRGPDQEAWAAAQREAFLGARRDRPMPEALPVAKDNHTGWSVDSEDVPVVEMSAQDKPEAAADSDFVCTTCTLKFNTANALEIHKKRAKHD